jgi:hypothetical protein
MAIKEQTFPMAVFGAVGGRFGGQYEEIRS